MRLILSILFSVSCTLYAKSCELKVDTSFIPSIRYTKKELKKEIKDVKLFNAQTKEWSKAIKQKNPDYLNVVFSKTIELLTKEHNELSNRISQRSKQLFPTKTESPTTSTGFEDKPKVYNSELKDQFKQVNKEDLLRKKAESDYLNNYIHIIRNEKTLMTKLKNVGTFDVNTPDKTYQEITRDFKAFGKELDEEIQLMKKETGKK